MTAVYAGALLAASCDGNSPLAGKGRGNDGGGSGTTGSMGATEDAGKPDAPISGAGGGAAGGAGGSTTSGVAGFPTSGTGGWTAGVAGAGAAGTGFAGFTGAAGDTSDGGVTDAAPGTIVGGRLDAGDPFYAVQIPDSFVLPGATLMWELHGRGTNVFKCVYGSGGDTGGFAPVWHLDQSTASLYDFNGAKQGAFVGANYFLDTGTWTSLDGSMLVGQTVQVKPTDAYNFFPWRLFEAVNHLGSGVLSDVTWVQQVNAKYEFPPAHNCGDPASTSNMSFPFSVDFYFYTGQAFDGGAD
jgi:hypothetical protein